MANGRSVIRTNFVRLACRSSQIGTVADSSRLSVRSECQPRARHKDAWPGLFITARIPFSATGRLFWRLRSYIPLWYELKLVGHDAVRLPGFSSAMLEAPMGVRFAGSPTPIPRLPSMSDIVAQKSDPFVRRPIDFAGDVADLAVRRGRSRN
jgi:hypothetical protein